MHGGAAPGMETLLLLGDSLAAYGDWQRMLPEFLTINRGIAGETVGEIAARLGREIDLDRDPERIVIFSGTNDMLMGDHCFPAVFATMLPRLRHFCPAADVTVVGLAPMIVPWLNTRRIEDMNGNLARVVKIAGSRFLDLFPVFALSCRPAIRVFLRMGCISVRMAIWFWRGRFEITCKQGRELCSVVDREKTSSYIY